MKSIDGCVGIGRRLGEGSVQRLRALSAPLLALLCGVASTACSAAPPDAEGSEGEEPVVVPPRPSGLPGPDLCFRGSIPEALNGIKRAKGLLAREKAVGSAAKQDFDVLQRFTRSGCHVQGLVRLPIGMAITFNLQTNSNTPFAEVPCPLFEDGTGARGRILRARSGDFDSSSAVPHSKNVFHPGGMAALGNYVFIVVDDGKSTGTPEIYVQDHTVVPPVLVTSFTVPGAGAIDSVAAGFDSATGLFHLIMNQDKKNQVLISKSQPNLPSIGIPTNFSKPQVLSTGNGRYPGKRSKKLNYQNMSLLRQCDGKMYLLGLTNNQYDDCSGNFDSCDESIIDYAEYTPSDPRVGAWSTTGELDNPCNGFLDLDICPNFAAGGTAFVTTRDGKSQITAWATEHWPGDNDLDILSWSSP